MVSYQSFHQSPIKALFTDPEQVLLLWLLRIGSSECSNLSTPAVPGDFIVTTFEPNSPARTSLTSSDVALAYLNAVSNNPSVVAKDARVILPSITAVPPSTLLASVVTPAVTTLVNTPSVSNHNQRTAIVVTDLSNLPSNTLVLSENNLGLLTRDDNNVYTITRLRNSQTSPITLTAPQLLINENSPVMAPAPVTQIRPGDSITVSAPNAVVAASNPCNNRPVEIGSPVNAGSPQIVNIPSLQQTPIMSNGLQPLNAFNPASQFVVGGSPTLSSANIISPPAAPVNFNTSPLMNVQNTVPTLNQMTTAPYPLVTPGNALMPSANVMSPPSIPLSPGPVLSSNGFSSLNAIHSPAGVFVAHGPASMPMLGGNLVVRPALGDGVLAPMDAVTVVGSDPFVMAGPPIFLTRGWRRRLRKANRLAARAFRAQLRAGRK